MTSGVNGSFGDETLAPICCSAPSGRKPVTDGLKLENAGLQDDRTRFIEADDYCRTKVANIFAIGDVTGKIQLAHYATAQGIAAAENAVQHEIAQARHAGAERDLSRRPKSAPPA